MKKIPSVTVDYIEKRNLEMYSKEFVPLMEKDRYGEAISYLVKNPEVENYLCASEWKELFEYSQSQLEATLNGWTVTELSSVEVPSLGKELKIPWDIGDEE